MEAKNIKDCTWGWLSPDGDVYGEDSDYTMSTLHYDMANDLVKGFYKTDKISGEQILMNLGWLKFSNEKVYGLCEKVKIMPIQRKRILEYMDARGYKILRLGGNQTAYSRELIDVATIGEFAGMVTGY